MSELARWSYTGKSNWQAVFSAAGDITVTLPDGTQFTGPSWQKVVTLLAQSDLEAIQPLADQVRADAQQVAADKTEATEAASIATVAATTAGDAATVATQAKADAAAAQTSAAASGVSAKADADRAEAAAETIDTTNFLRKEDNLASVADKGAARTNLEVYSKDEFDARANALENRLGYALIDAIRPGAVYLPLGTRTVFQNPFGNNTPVYCVVEFLHPSINKWVAGTWQAMIDGAAVFFGINAWYNEGEGIVVRTGSNGYSAASRFCGSNNEFSGNVTTTGPIRVHVWRVAS